MLRAGSLNSRIKLQALGETQSASGAPTQGWADVAEVWANIRAATGSGSAGKASGGQVARRRASGGGC